MRIGGLASGMDIDQMVKDLMRVERAPLDKLYQQKVLTEWKQEDMRSINTKLLGLRDSAFDLRLQSTFINWNATSSNEGVITASANSSSQVGSYDIAVHDLATPATLISAKDGEGQGALERFNAFKGEDNVNIPEEGYTFQIRSNKTLDEDGNPAFIDITINKNDNLNDVLNKINRNADLNVNAFFDEHQGRIVFNTRHTGSEAKIEFNMEDMSTKEFVDNVLNNDNGQWMRNDSGTNAKLTINGLATERQSNNFEINGTNITLHDVGSARINIEQDSDKAFENIMSFVEMYNDTIDKLNAKLREPRNRDYLPLTDEQKRAMSDREVEQWEERARSGMLRGDRMLSGVLSNIRTAIMSPVAGLEGEINNLNQIGIRTGPWHENGKLHVDEAKLRDALRENPEEVMALFRNDSEEEAELGIARRLRDTIGRGIDNIARTAGRAENLYDQSFMSNEIRRYEQRMAAMEDRLQQVEERYWRQFTAMERAINQMNSQSEWLYMQTMQMMG